MKNILEQYERFTEGSVQVIPKEVFKKKVLSGESLIIKLGLDPTAPDLHLGHAVVLKKLRQFQEAGHTVVFLIGDYTARIGDPTGKSKTRPSLSAKEIEENTKTYFKQVSRILDPQKIQVRYNSEWLDKLTSIDFLKLCAKTTVAQLLERDDFQKRMKKHEPVSFHELLYPLMQGYDSVALSADVELGGTDQTFNLLMGRHLQEAYNQPPQAVITMPLLEGLDGIEKMSKSLGNAIGIAEPAGQAYGKLMSISDTLMWRYMTLLLDYSATDTSELKKQVESNKKHPMDIKKKMAYEVVAAFWNHAEADSAQIQFQNLFQKKDYSSAKEIKIAESNEKIWIVDLLKNLKIIQTSSEGKRLITSRSVSIDGELVEDFKAQVVQKPGLIIKAGKHKIYKLIV